MSGARILAAALLAAVAAYPVPAAAHARQGGGQAAAAADPEPVPSPPAQTDVRTRILVLPFENPPREPRLVWLGEASAILLADALNARGLAAIMRMERVRAFEQLHLPASASLSRATVIKAGQILGASEVIGGSYHLEGDVLVVEAHSVQIDVGRVRPQISERGPLTDLFAIFDRLAHALAGGTPRGSASAPHPPLGAFESYVKGLLAESAPARATFLETAVRDFPAFERARLALWEVRAEQDDHASALAAVKPLEGESLHARRGRLRAGVSLLEMKDYAAASAAFTRLLDPAILETTNPPAPEFAPVLNNLGVTQLRRGAGADAGSATYYFTRASDADRAEPDYQFNLGYAYALERNYKAGIYWLREAVRRDVADADAHYLLAIALQATGSAVEASRERDLAARLSSRYEELGAAWAQERPAVPQGLERLRTDLEPPRAERPDQAMVDWAQREQRDLALFHLERGRRLFEREQDREAIAELRRAVYLSPYDADAHLLIGRIHLRGGRTADAIDALKISIWSEDGAPARTALAQAYLTGRNAEAARAELGRALELDPGSVEATELLGTIK